MCGSYATLCLFFFQFKEKSKETQCNSRPAEINTTFGDSFMTCSSRTKPIICFSSQPTLNRLNIVADHVVVLILFALIRSWCHHWPLFYVTGFYCLQVWKRVLLLCSWCRDVFHLGTLRFVIVETTFMDLEKRKLNSVLYLWIWRKKRKLSLKSHEVSNLLGPCHQTHQWSQELFALLDFFFPLLAYDS